LCLAQAKRKAAKEAEKPYGYSRFAYYDFLPTFSFDERSAKEKVIKKKTLFFVGSAHTRDLLKKVDQNFPSRSCEHSEKSKFGALSFVA
jgi:hypothetical protein